MNVSKLGRWVAALLATLLAAPLGATARDRTHHTLRVELDPAAGRLAVVDRVDLARGGEVDFLLHARLSISSSEPRVAEVPLGDIDRFTGINAAPGRTRGRRGAQTLPGRASRRGRDPAPRIRWRLRLRSRRPEAGVHARLARDGRDRLGDRCLSGGQRLLVPGLRRRSARLRPRGRPCRAAGTSISQGDGTSRGDDGEARWELGTGRSTRSTSSVGRSLVYRDPPAASRRWSTCASRTTRSPRTYLERHGAVPRDVPRADRSLPVRQVRARRELLGDGLRHALVHPARPAGHPASLHPRTPPTRTRSSTTGGATRSSSTTRAATGARG